MKDGLWRTVVATALVTALSVSALAFFVGPRLMKASSPMDGMNMQPAVYDGPAQDDNSAQNGANSQTSANSQSSGTQPQLRRRPSAARSTSSERAYSSQNSYDEPVTHHHRSTAKSALIVAGSAGTGAAIGAIAGGGKGAGIGALSGRRGRPHLRSIDSQQVKQPLTTPQPPAPSRGSFLSRIRGPFPSSHNPSTD